jgi:hypothetical protein
MMEEGMVFLLRSHAVSVAVTVLELCSESYLVPKVILLSQLLRPH